MGPSPQASRAVRRRALSCFAGDGETCSQPHRTRAQMPRRYPMLARCFAGIHPSFTHDDRDGTCLRAEGDVIKQNTAWAGASEVRVRLEMIGLIRIRTD
jgi:hypothetical protein